MVRRFSLRKWNNAVEGLNGDLKELEQKGINTKDIRIKVIKAQQALFDVACDNANNPELPPKSRHEWGRIASYASQVLLGYLNGLDETCMDEDLRELKFMVEQVKATKEKMRIEKKTNTATPRAEEALADSESPTDT